MRRAELSARQREANRSPPATVAFGRTVPSWLLLPAAAQLEAEASRSRSRTPSARAAPSASRKQAAIPPRRSGRPGSPRRTPEKTTSPELIAQRPPTAPASDELAASEIHDYERWPTIHVISGGGEDSPLSVASAPRSVEPEPEPEPEPEQQVTAAQREALWAAALTSCDRSDWEAAVEALTSLLDSSDGAGSEADADGQRLRGAPSPARCLQWRGYAHDRAGHRELGLADFT